MDLDQLIERITRSAETISHHHRDYPKGAPVSKEQEIMYVAARRTIHEAKQELKAALTHSPWIPCSERLPTEADGYVWTFDADDKTIKIEPWNQLFHFIHRYDYTHWKPTGMVRPEPPEVEG